MGTIDSKPKLSTSYCKGSDIDYNKLEPLHTCPDWIQHYASKKPNKEAVVFHSTTAPRYTITWKELFDRSHKMAKALIQLGIQPGECVAVISRSCPEYLYVAFGVMMAAARLVNLVFTYKDGSDFVQAMKKIGNCSMIVLDAGLEESNWTILKTIVDHYDSSGTVQSSKLPYLRNLLFIDALSNENVKTICDLLGDEYPSVDLPQVDPQEVAIMFLTSGSTGVPKLVGHAQTNLTKLRPSMISEAYSEDDILFSDRPFAWAGGFPFGLLIGQTRVTVSGFCPEPKDKVSFLIDIISREKCTVTGMFPHGIHELLERKDELPDDWSLRTIWTGGQPVTKAVTGCLGKICKNFGTVYGGTEVLFCTAMLVSRTEDFVDYAGGTPSAGVELKIVGEDGSIVPLNERGEIYIRNQYMFAGYFSDPERMARAFTEDGWYKTDDYGRMNEQGYVFIEGRISDMIISGAMNVTPSILEAVLKSNPSIDQAVIVPVPDVALYQVVCAFVTLQQGCKVTENNLREYMENIHNDQQKLFTVFPKYYVMLEKFPEESNGKVSRKSLRKMAEQMFAEKA